MKINDRFFAVGLLVLLCCFVMPLWATEPPCPDCESRDPNGNCVSDCNGSEVCCGGSCLDCGSGDCCGNSCCANICCDNVCCDSGEMCCGGSVCCDSNSCCGDTCCNATQYCCGDPLWNEVCCNANEICCSGLDPNFDPFYYCASECCYDSDCDTLNCEECVDGSCEYACTSNQCCDNGTCKDKVWTKETIAGSTTPCPACDGIIFACDGAYTVINNYEKCVNVGVGGGVHSECDETSQVVGYSYDCVENFDVSLILSCAAQCACCVLDCRTVLVDPAPCANCLTGAVLDCCGGGDCGYCDFVDECEPYPDIIYPMTTMAFSSFGGCN